MEKVKTIRETSLKEIISRVPRVPLGCYPTPLVEAKGLSRALGGPRILIKRDDLSGLALGGNKCRQIEFLMGYAREKGFDTILYGRGYKKKNQSNYAVQLIAAGKKTGIGIRICMRGDPPSSMETSGNDLLQAIMAPEVSWLGDSETHDDFVSMVLREADRLREEGRSPYIMQTIYRNQTPIERIGWVNAAGEIDEQLKALNIDADYLVIAHSQGGTQSGLVVGAKYLKATFKVIGISVKFPRDKQILELDRMTNETANYLGLGIQFAENEMIVYDEYIGNDYDSITPGSVEAIQLVAQTEGIFLDPVYTGKSMAGLIDLIRKGRLTSKETVVFVHTGGTPAIFQYGDHLAESG